jgi:hypothetical protein
LRVFCIYSPGWFETSRDVLVRPKEERNERRPNAFSTSQIASLGGGGESQAQGQQAAAEEKKQVLSRMGWLAK